MEGIAMFVTYLQVSYHVSVHFYLETQVQNSTLIQKSDGVTHNSNLWDWSTVCREFFDILPYEKELYQNICDISSKYIAHICKLYLSTMSVYVSYMYMLHICRIRSNIYVTYM